MKRNKKKQERICYNCKNERRCSVMDKAMNTACKDYKEKEKKSCIN